MILDTLSAIDVSFDVDTAALDPLSLDQVTAFLGLPDSEVPSEPLNTATPLSLIEIFSPGFSQTFDDAIALLDTATGTLTLSEGKLSGTVTTEDGTETIALDGTSFFDAVLTEAATLTATATLDDGVFTGALNFDDGSRYVANIDAGRLLNSAVFMLLDQADIVVPFANGQFTLDVSTALGDITGSIDFAGGDLNLDLSTPLGDLDVNYAFPIGAAVAFDFASPIGTLTGSLDFASGQVTVPLTFGNISLGAISLALEDLSGEVAINNGRASLTVNSFGSRLFGVPETLTTDIDLGPLASELVETFTEDTTGSLTVDAGLVNASIFGPLGNVETTFSLVELATNAVDVIVATTGTLTLDNGNVSAAISSPIGTTDTVTTLSDLQNFFTSPFLS